MTQLMALALNPNLTQAQFEKLAAKYMDNKIRLFELAAECAKKLPIEDRVNYLSSVLPILMMF